MLDEEKEKSEMLEKQVMELEAMLQDRKLNYDDTIPYELSTETSVECMTPTTVTLEESPTSEDLYASTFDTYKDDEPSPEQIKSNRLDCLIISTQSI